MKRSALISDVFHLNGYFLFTTATMFAILITFTTCQNFTNQQKTMTFYDLAGIVEISEKNITAFNNRNISIICRANLKKSTAKHEQTQSKLSFSTNARMVLSFMTKPRDKKPLHQMQSFLHCIDPDRTECLNEFSFDVSCLEDQIDRKYLSFESYQLEAACQVDDLIICSSRWLKLNPRDCYDLADVIVINSPKLGDRCITQYSNETLQCGLNQECSPNYGICLCEQNYIAYNKQCIPYTTIQDDDDDLFINENNSTKILMHDIAMQPSDDDDDNDYASKLKVSKSTLRAMVIFLLIIAILLCIALAIVIIWSRHNRRLLKNAPSTTSATSST